MHSAAVDVVSGLHGQVAAGDTSLGLVVTVHVVTGDVQRKQSSGASCIGDHAGFLDMKKRLVRFLRIAHLVPIVALATRLSGSRTYASPWPPADEPTKQPSLSPIKKDGSKPAVCEPSHTTLTS